MSLLAVPGLAMPMLPLVSVTMSFGVVANRSLDLQDRLDRPGVDPRWGAKKYFQSAVPMGHADHQGGRLGPDPVAAMRMDEARLKARADYAAMTQGQP